MVKKTCENCSKEIEMFPSRAKKANVFFCNKSCHRTYKNKKDNPSWKRDLSGENNPMFGKSKEAWNKGLKGELSHNWKGGLHKRKDGYFRINIDGERYLYHRHLLGLINSDKVVHHKDNNPSNNELDNLEVFEGQSQHIKYGHSKLTRKADFNSLR